MKVSTTGSSAVNYQRLPFFAFFACFFDAMVGSNSSWGQAPFNGTSFAVHGLNVCPVIREAAVDAVPGSVKVVNPFPSRGDG